MITAVDTNVILDLLIPGAPHQEESLKLLKDSLNKGSLVIPEVVYAELSSQFQSRETLDSFLNSTGIQLNAVSKEALWIAGMRWKAYRRQRKNSIYCSDCGKRATVGCAACGAVIHFKQHIISDFVIGGFSLVQAQKLLTRDRGFYRTYFADLEIISSQ